MLQKADSSIPASQQPDTRQARSLLITERMAKHYLLLIVIALTVISVASSLAIPLDSASPRTRTRTRTAHSPSSPSSPASSPSHHGNTPAPPSSAASQPSPTPTSAVKAVAANPPHQQQQQQQQQHSPKIPPIVLILSILFGIPLLAFLVVTLALSSSSGFCFCCCRHRPEPEPQEKEGTTLNTWDVFRKDRHAAMHAAAKRLSSPSSPGRRAGIGIGLGLANVDLGPSSSSSSSSSPLSSPTSSSSSSHRVIRHTPRKPSPLREVYTAAAAPAEFGAAASSLPRSALHFSRGASRRSSAGSTATPSPRTPSSDFDRRGAAAGKHLDRAGGHGIVRGGDADGTELDISDPYFDSFFVLGEEGEDGRGGECLIGTACW